MLLPLPLFVTVSASPVPPVFTMCSFPAGEEVPIPTLSPLLVRNVFGAVRLHRLAPAGMTVHDKVPEPSVFSTSPLPPSAFGSVHILFAPMASGDLNPT